MEKASSGKKYWKEEEVVDLGIVTGSFPEFSWKNLEVLVREMEDWVIEDDKSEEKSQDKTWLWSVLEVRTSNW